MSFHPADRFATLDKQGLIIHEYLQVGDDIVEGLEIPGCFTATSVNNQFIRTFRYFRIEIIQQHTQGGFLDPSFTV